MFEMRGLLLFGLLLPGLLAGCLDATPDDARSPYVDQTDTEIRGLSADEIEDLRSGAGMGLARPAELNGYPGPLHVLELADALGLSEAQRDEVQALRDAVVADASALGAEVLARHARLEALFRTDDVDAAALRAEIEALDAAYAELRFVHLKAHLETHPILTEHQRMRYDQLRGYTEEDARAHDGAGHAGH